MNSRDHADAPDRGYVGRFAPSPTGDLHFGSLVAAIASYLQARTQGGAWLLRVEDIDPPREVEGSAQGFLADLRRLGLRHDGEVVYQRHRLNAHQAARTQLIEDGLAFRCRCSRKQLPDDGVYPGTCRHLALGDERVQRTRLRAPDEPIRFRDRVMGEVVQELAKDIGDFVVWRADGWPAYQLAVVVDDAWQGVTEVVRGADLLDSTPRQIALQRALRLPTPTYLHVPLAVGADGNKLSKRARSDPLRSSKPEQAIALGLQFLGHTPPPGLDLDGLWAWAFEHWDSDRIPRQRAIPLPRGVASR